MKINAESILKTESDHPCDCCFPVIVTGKGVFNSLELTFTARWHQKKQMSFLIRPDAHDEHQEGPHRMDAQRTIQISFHE